MKIVGITKGMEKNHRIQAKFRHITEFKKFSFVSTSKFFFLGTKYKQENKIQIFHLRTPTHTHIGEIEY